MKKNEFLNLVAQGASQAFPYGFRAGYESNAQWEIQAQVIIADLLREKYNCHNVREAKYPESMETCDFLFNDDGKSYAVELKVESPTTHMFAGMSLSEAIKKDVTKIKKMNADKKWVIVVVASFKKAQQLNNFLEGLSFLGINNFKADSEYIFMMALFDANKISFQ